MLHLREFVENLPKNMQIEVIGPKRVEGRVALPASKSISNRVLVINQLAGATNGVPRNVSDCDDTRVMLRWLAEQPAVVDIGAAGTAMRFSSALLAVTPGERVITGTERMKNRPIAVLVDALRELGAEVEYVEKEGFPPLRIKGRDDLEGGALTLPGNVSSQYVSALLMIGPVLKQGLRLTLTGTVISRPYINLTMQLMREFGAEVDWVSENEIVVGTKHYVSRDYYVENDWSAASYWYEMVALSEEGAEVVLPGLFKESYQGDAKVAEIFEKLSVKSTFFEEEGVSCVRLRKQGKVCERLDYDFVNQPDLAQTFVVTCCLMGVPFRFTGLQSLKIKETDRIAALIQEMGKLGFRLSVESSSKGEGEEGLRQNRSLQRKKEDVEDVGLMWEPGAEDSEVEPSNLMMEPEAIDTYEDHRMAMSFAPAAMCVRRLKVNEPQVVSKSYPGFWEALRSVGFSITS